MNFFSRSILVLGLGRSGLAAARLLQRAGAIVSVVDSGTSKGLQERADLLRSEGMTVHLGAAAENDTAIYDYAILSPGIEATTPLVSNVTRKGTPLLGEIELAFSLCKAPVIAITGSNGKTTTTELTVRALQGAGARAIACGNIGLPFSEAVLHGDAVDFFVVEVSSFQLETTKHFHPKVAVWLNLTPNHLDRYPSLDEYRAAKLRIFRCQTDEDIAVIPKDFDLNKVKLQAGPITFSAVTPMGDFSFENDQLCYRKKPFLNIHETCLRGLHNVENLMAAFAVGKAFHLPLEAMADAIKDYTPPAHRCEFVVRHHDIEWINDSKATTLDAMEKAITGVKADRPILLIAGGKNKGSSFLPMLPLIQERVKEAILIGEMSDCIAADWKTVSCRKASSMEEAVTLAGALVTAGDTILLSPGTSSYDMFNDYQERGDAFKHAVFNYVNSLVPSTPEYLNS